ncbi:MAG TPA: thioredoxin family protein [Acidimicrobiales bacterium]|nr:thioredoxin family protein [Acidimicrobiales bacterium]
MKLVIVAVIVVGLIVGRRLYLQRQARHRTVRVHSPKVPEALLDGADRTWVVFTTPYCASCGPVKERLAEDDPSARIVTVDATREPHLAQAFAVRSAPTVLLAGADGAVQARLVGAPAVRDYLAARTA